MASLSELRLSGQRVAVLALDSTTTSVNALDTALGDAIDAAFGELLALLEDGGDEVALIILCSRKPGYFVAGADVQLQLDLTSEEDAIAASGRFHAFLRRVEALPVPTLAIINGLALGGGLEMALACTFRAAVRSASLGLPESALAICPGGGGMVRLPRLIGLREAVTMIVSGKPVSAQAALASGLVDLLLERAEWPSDNPDAAATATATSTGNDGSAAGPQWALEIGHALTRGVFAHGPRRHIPTAAPSLLDRTWAYQQLVYSKTLEQVRAKAGTKYPSPYVILDTLFRAFNAPFADALEMETRAYAKLVMTPQAKHALALFRSSVNAKRRATTLPDQTAASTGGSGTPAAPTAFAITVVGAGYMGSAIAQALLHAGCFVTLVDPSEDALDDAHERIEQLFAPRVRKGQLTSRDLATCLAERLTVSTELMLPKMPPKTNPVEVGMIVLDCAPESIDLKRDLAAQALRLYREASEGDSNVPRGSFVFASNTSSIPITRIASSLSDEDAAHVVGMHFFHPEYNYTPCVEVCAGERTAPAAVRAVASLATRMGKTPFLVGDVAGFVVNRVAAAWYAEAAQLVVEGGATVRRIDDLMKAFGFVKGPFAILDSIGLKTALSVGELMQTDQPAASSAVIELFRELLERGFEGRGVQGNGAGFYLWRNGRVVDINPAMKTIVQVVRSRLAHASNSARPEEQRLATPRLHTLSDAVVTDSLLAAMAIAADELAEAGHAEPADIDTLLVMSIGFPPSHGGILEMVRVWGAEAFAARIAQLMAITRHSWLAPRTRSFGKTLPAASSTVSDFPAPASPPSSWLPLHFDWLSALLVASVGVATGLVLSAKL
eukprot:m.223498 g.223498  ORF g.223498 m.223498 type:complete len:840 (-) comp10825_c2_seq1:179-2698(-)